MQRPGESLGDSREQSGTHLAAEAVAFPAGARRGRDHEGENSYFSAPADAVSYRIYGSTGSQPDGVSAEQHGSASELAGPRTPDSTAAPTTAPARAEHFIADDHRSGSSVPGQLRVGDSTCDATATSDAPVDGAQTEQSMRGGAERVGCVVTGDPSQGPMCPMNHPTFHRRRLTTAKIENGSLVLKKLEAVRDYRQANENAAWSAITKATGVTPVQFCRWQKRLKKDGLTLDSQRSALIECLAKESPPGRKPKFSLTETEAAAVAAHNLQSNRTATAGSPQEALRHAIKRGEVNPETAATIAQRENDGKPLLTEAMRRQVQVGETTTRADRTPREAWLNYVQSPGSLQITVDAETGEERMFVPGEAWTMDDATINLICCCPLERPGDKCWDKFGVMVGRFQFIVVADHRSYFIPGFSYTARPRSSYRAEDLTATLQITMRQHGMPKQMFLENGISAANLVRETLKLAGIKVKHVKSPHQKIVELLFNKLWTKLSFLPGQTGRHMADDEETNKLLQRCRAGQVDPRKHFMMIGDVVKALREAIEDHNGQWVAHSRYGRWIPRDFWNAKSSTMLRPLDDASEWIFSPVVTDPLIVKGSSVGTTVRLMDGLSQKFTFGAEWLLEFHRASVKLHFNPFLDAPAKVVLAKDFRGFKAGAILGDAEMTDRHARFNLRKLGYGDFPDIGLAAARQHAQALRRSVVSIRPDGKPGIVANEARDMKQLPTPNENTAPVPTEKFLRRAKGMGVEDEEFNRQAAKLQRDEERAAARKQPVFVEE